jgi:hypothetical protein
MRDAALLREAFAVLGVGHLASAEQVRAAWKRKLKTAHPDVGGTKEAVQHATNMRDVLLAWIKAGRPDLDAQTDPAWGYASARSRTQDFPWQDVTPPGPAEPPHYQPASSWHGFWTVAGIWGLSLMIGVLSGGHRKESRPIGTHQQPFLPPCITDSLHEILHTKCRPARSLLMDYPEFANAPPDLPICTGMDIFAETRALVDGNCWPAWSAAQTRTSAGVPSPHGGPVHRKPGGDRHPAPPGR